MAPEFLNSSGSFNGDDLDSPELEASERPTLTSSVFLGVSSLAELPSSTDLHSIKKFSTLFSAPSRLSSIGCSDLSTSFDVVPSKGADALGIENHEENAMEECLDPIPSRLPLEASLEQEHHDGLGLKEWLSCKKTDGLLARNLHDHKCSESNAVDSQSCHSRSYTAENDTKVTTLHGSNEHEFIIDSFFHGSNQREGANASGIKSNEENLTEERIDPKIRASLEHLSEQEHHDGMWLKEWLSSKKADGLLLPTSHEHKFSGLNTSDDNDSKHSILHCFDEHGGGFEDGCSTSSGLHEKTEQDVAKTFGEAHLTTFMSQTTKGDNQEMHNNEPEDTICNVKFTREKNWIAGQPLEVLLGEMPDTELKLSTGRGNGDFSVDVHNSLILEDIVWKTDSGGSFVAEVLPCTFYEDAMS